MGVVERSDIVLAGKHVRLEPLDRRHAEDLTAASAGADSDLYRWSFVPVGAEAVRAYIETAIRWRDEGNAFPFATVRLSDGKTIGSSRFFDVERWGWPAGYDNAGRPFDACEIGYTWLAPDAIRTAANTEAKLLMLTHAFETWNLWRVVFHTDERNQRSRNALSRIGAKFEGISRAYRIATDVTPRNSARFSILASEWPEIRRQLSSRV